MLESSLLQLSAPLVSIDLETTGVHPKFDRVVQIGLVKLYPDGRLTEWSTHVNPQVAIPPESTEIHHITDAMVAVAPKFKDLAGTLAKGFELCDFCGYNVGFDIRFLTEEFLRVGMKDVMNGRIVDANRIYHVMMRRNLEAAVAEFLGEKFVGAHDALIDARAAIRVFFAQLKRFPELPRSVEQLHRMFFETPEANQVDPEGKLAWRHGEVVVNFGKYATSTLRDLTRSGHGHKYLQWMISGEFSPEVKRIVRDALAGKFPTRERKKHEEKEDTKITSQGSTSTGTQTGANVSSANSGVNQPGGIAGGNSTDGG